MAKYRKVNAEIIGLCNRYGVSSAKDMDEKRGELEEEDTWRDFSLNHLEERRETLEKLLEEASVEQSGSP